MWLCLLRHTNTPLQEYAFTVCVVSQYRGGREEWPSWNIVCVCVCPCKKKTPSENVRLHLRRFAFLSACICMCMCVVLRDLEVICNCSTVEEQRQQSHTPWLSLSIIGMCVCWVQLICWSEYDISEAFTALLEMADWLTAEQMWHPKATNTDRAVFKLRWFLLQTLISVNNNNSNNIKNY